MTTTKRNHQTLLLVSDVLQQQPQDGHGPKEGDDIVVGEMVDIDVNHESFSSQVKERYPVGDPFATLNDDGSDDEEEETSGYDNGKEKERNKNKPEITDKTNYTTSNSNISNNHINLGGQNGDD
eukprot:CAMPEP_0116577772 /NCGR_PEP_ID=MMETSP0397-20121206/21329_1 /TAXON_ID=216820 /ORGANISM="Cyclophora tenuis, Strain ECT3854" /LENGTH=123 /DNA_ID=CAMNT_0004107073 /DNA_START=88 /DNA_END=460 /DNA_ORIENTATION=+